LIEKHSSHYPSNEDTLKNDIGLYLLLTNHTLQELANLTLYYVKEKRLSQEKSQIYSLRKEKPNVNLTPFEQTCSLTILEPIPGGSTNVLLKLKKDYPLDEMGILICANSGRPGGAVGHIRLDGSGYVDNLHHNHNGQEEDIVSNWLLTHSVIKNMISSKLFNDTIGGSKNRWGLTYPDPSSFYKTDRNDDRIFETKQGKKNYRIAKPQDYEDAWLVTNCLVSEKNKEKFNYENFERCNLVFVAGPLARERITTYNGEEPKKQGDYISTMQRTINEKASVNFNEFLLCVRSAFLAFFKMMALRKIPVAILGHVSGGIYAGPWKSNYGTDSDLSKLKTLISGILQEDFLGYPLGRYFKLVVFSEYADPIPSYWSNLYYKIRNSEKTCYLLSEKSKSDSNPNPKINAFCSNELYYNKNPELTKEFINFQDEIDEKKYKYFKSLSKNMLLVPPWSKGATNINDFAFRYEIEDWNNLYIEIRKHWEKNIYVSTEGSSVPYLHIRYETHPVIKRLNLDLKQL
jgi:hypothetical protein